MILKMIDKLWEETRTMPWLFLTIVCLVLGGAWMWKNYVHADELDKYVTKAEFSAFTSEVAEISNQVTTNSVMVVNIYALSLASEMRDVYDQWCKSEDEDVRAILSTNIARLQSEYSELKDTDYNIEDCID